MGPGVFKGLGEGRMSPWTEGDPFQEVDFWLKSFSALCNENRRNPLPVRRPHRGGSATHLPPDSQELKKKHGSAQREKMRIGGFFILLGSVNGPKIFVKALFSLEKVQSHSQMMVGRDSCLCWNMEYY